MLTQETENIRRTDLRAILYGLASSLKFLENTTTLEGIFLKLEEIYSDGQFRHYYSDIYSIITDVDSDPEKGNLDILSQNLLYIKENEIEDLSENTKHSIRKLYDHANLDISRINYIKSLQSRNISKEKEILELQKQIQEKHDALDSTVKSTRKDLGELYANILTIMGIFVAVFAFIAVNSNITFQLTQENQVDVFWGIVKINIFVAVCIIALVISLKLFVIKPLLGNKKDGKE